MNISMRQIIDTVTGESSPLTEARISVLFHGTSIFNLLQIMEQNILRHDLGDDEFHLGVSFSRSFWVAAKFAEQAEEMTADFEDFEKPKYGWCAGAVISLNRALILQQTLLTPLFVGTVFLWNKKNAPMAPSNK